MKKKFYLILDTETAGTTDKPLVYDIGWQVVDRKGNIYKTASYVVSDIFFEGKNKLEVSEKMKTAYYNEKLPQYYRGIKKGEWKINNFYSIRKELLKDIEEFNCSVCAYNAYFDINALNNTLSYLTNGKYRYCLKYDTPVMCIQHMACQTIYTMRKYYKFCMENGFVTEKGNISTKAETGYAFLKNQINYEERHTALEDCKIEWEIMQECFKKHKRMKTGINRGAWRIPQKRKGK